MTAYQILCFAAPYLALSLLVLGIVWLYNCWVIKMQKLEFLYFEKVSDFVKRCKNQAEAASVLKVAESTIRTLIMNDAVLIKGELYTKFKKPKV